MGNSFPLSLHYLANFTLKLCLLILPPCAIFFLADVLEVKDINCLARTNRHFNALLTPYLYRRNVTRHSSSTLPMDRHAPDAGGVDINALGGLDWTSLFRAFWTGDDRLASRLIEYGADLRPTPVAVLGVDGVTSLHAAAFGGCSVPALEYLIKDCNLRLDIGATDAQGQTPLFYAVMGGKEDVVRCLIRNGADPNVRNRMGLTPAWTLPHVNAHAWTMSMLTVLFEKGVDINAKGKGGRTLLHVAVQELQTEPQTLIHLTRSAIWGARPKLSMVQFLLDYGAAINARDDDGWTPLHLAAELLHVDNVRLLLEYGANVHARTDGYQAPVDMYTPMDDEVNCEVTRLLCERGL